MERVPPKISSRGKLPPPLVTVVLAAGAVMVAATVFFFDPATHRLFPGCTFHRVTGLNCPGCGATRSLHALLHGDFPTALRDNALYDVTIIFFIARGGWFLANHFCGRVNGAFFPAKFFWPLLAAAVIFGVLRNLPAFAFLSP
jgi:hypothetical protein